MPKFNNVTSAVSTAALVFLTAGPAMAGAPVPQLPGPGILGLVAGGLITAIAVARLRK